MFSFSCRLFRQLVRHKPLRLPHKNFHLNALLRRTSSLKIRKMNDLKDLKEFEYNLKQVDLTETVKLFNKYSKPEEIQWDEINKALLDLGVQNPRKVILMTCVRTGKLDVGMSYYNYISQQTEELTALECLLFSKLLSGRSEEILKHAKLIEDLYKKVRVYMLSSILIRKSALSVFVNLPNCFWDCVERFRNTQTTGNEALVVRAFEINEPEVAWEFMDNPKFIFRNDILKSYVGHCINMALDGKFSLDLINKLVNVCSKRMWCLTTGNLEFDLKPLIEALKVNVNDYTLSMEKCQISNKNVCSNCGLTLNKTPLSNAECDTLKDEFFKTFINNNHVIFSTSKVDTNKFITFLNNCKPYNLVFDGLNMLYRGRTAGIKFYNELLSFFLERGYKILVISRHHSQGMIFKAPCLRQNLGRNVQFFLASDTSNDDLFLLYAAMHGGPDTFLCSGDLLTPYSVHLKPETQILFKKWKISHQFILQHNINMLNPWPHMGLPQLTATPTKDNDCHIWHLPYYIFENSLARDKNIQWGCVKAIPRSKT